MPGANTTTQVGGYGGGGAGGDLLSTNNLSDVASAATSRTNLGLGTLATQNGTFSGTSSGTNTGDQIISDATITTTDITTNNFTTAKHGFVPKGTNVGNYLKDDGTWAAVSAGSTIVGITGTTAEFNTALTDNNFATLAGSEVLTNKTLTTVTTTGATTLYSSGSGGFTVGHSTNVNPYLSTSTGLGLSITNISAANGVITLALYGRGSSAIADGFATILAFYGETSTTNDQDMGSLRYLWTTSANATRTSSLQVQLTNSTSTNAYYEFRPASFLKTGTTSGTHTITWPATITSHTWTMPSAQGSASTVLSNDGSGNLSWAAAGGVTGFTSSLNTSSPNNTVNASMLLASGGSTNQVAVIQPKGTGAFQLQLADSTTTGGNVRGANAIDLQTVRSAATGVASGASSVAIGVRNIASAADSVGIGYGNTASGANSLCLGLSNTASASKSVAIGDTNTSSGSLLSVAIGRLNTASGSYALATGFRSAATLTGQRAHSDAMFAATGDCQYSDLTASIETTNATETELFLGGSGVAARLTIASSRSLAFDVRVFGKAHTGTQNRFHCRIEGTISNNSGTTAIDGTNVTTSITNTAGTWSATVTADDTNDALVVKVIGAAATTIRWLATIRLVELQS